jgi:WD40 repeat protein
MANYTGVFLPEAKLEYVRKMAGKNMKIALKIALIFSLINPLFAVAKTNQINHHFASNTTAKKTISERITLNSGHSAGTAWNPDGKTLASASAENKTIQIWDTNKGHLIKILATNKDEIKNDEIKTLAWSRDGQKFAAASSDRIFIWNVSTGKLIKTFGGIKSGAAIRAIAWNVDNETLAVLENNRIQLWNTTTGKLHKTLVDKFPNVATGKAMTNKSIVPCPSLVRSFAWSPDGKMLASVGSLHHGCGSDNTIKLWDKTTGKLIKTLTGQNGQTNDFLSANAGASRSHLLAIAWSRDGKFIATRGINNAIELWDMTTHKFIKTLVGNDSAIIDLAWYGGSTTLAAIAQDKTIKFWDISTGSAILPRGVADSAIATVGINLPNTVDVAWSDDGKKLASGKFSKNIQVWDIKPF